MLLTLIEKQLHLFSKREFVSRKNNGNFIAFLCAKAVQNYAL